MKEIPSNNNYNSRSSKEIVIVWTKFWVITKEPNFSTC